MAALFMNHNISSFDAATTATMSIVTPTAIPTTTTTFTMPFLVTSMSHRTLHSLNKASSSNKHHIKDFSPVTLSTEWSSMARLLVLACLAVVGSIGNVFMISSVMIEDHLKKAGEYPTDWSTIILLRSFFFFLHFQRILIRKFNFNRFPREMQTIFYQPLI